MSRVALAAKGIRTCRSFSLDPLEPRLFLSGTETTDPIGNRVIVTFDESFDAPVLIKMVSLGSAEGADTVYLISNAETGELLAATVTLEPFFREQIPQPTPSSNPTDPTPSTPEAPSETPPENPPSVHIIAKVEPPPVAAPQIPPAEASLQQFLQDNHLSQVTSDSDAAAQTNAASADSPADTPAHLAARMVAAFSAVQLGAVVAAVAAAPHAVHVAEAILPEVAQQNLDIDTLDLISRDYHIAEFGSPFRLLADSLAHFADESASFPLRSTATRPGSAATITAAVVAADLILGAYAYHRAWQRRHARPAGIYRS